MSDHRPSSIAPPAEPAEPAEEVTTTAAATTKTTTKDPTAATTGPVTPPAEDGGDGGGGAENRGSTATTAETIKNASVAKEFAEADAEEEGRTTDPERHPGAGAQPAALPLAAQSVTSPTTTTSMDEGASLPSPRGGEGPSAATPTPSVVGDGGPSSSSFLSSSTAATTTTIATKAAPAQPPQLIAWPTDPSRYRLGAQIGKGAFATVWKAEATVAPSGNDDLFDGGGDNAAPTSLPPSQEQQRVVVVAAVKVLNLESTDTNLDEIRHEVQAMRLSHHPNLLNMHAAFLSRAELWLVTPLMRKGSSVSCVQLARRHHYYQQQKERRASSRSRTDDNDSCTTGDDLPGGPSNTNSVPQQERKAPISVPPPPTTPPRLLPMEEHILFVLRETVLGLQYLHDGHQIHRDVKGGNILLDEDGTVKLGDFGVSRIVQSGTVPSQRASTFVGTPCWMAPEVMQQIQQGYDCSIDIWSLGITALELAMGYAPYAKYPPMKVLIRTIQEDPPSLATYRNEQEQLPPQKDHVRSSIRTPGRIDSSDTADNDEARRAPSHPSPDDFSPSFEAFVDACLQKDASRRPTCADLLQRHLAVTDEADREERRRRLVEQVLNVVPAVGEGRASSTRSRASSRATRGERGEGSGAAPGAQAPAPPVPPALGFGVQPSPTEAVSLIDAAGPAYVSEAVRERQPGTTWVFADGAGSMSASKSSSQHGGGDEDSAALLEEEEEEAGAHDVLRALDEFERQTGGEHYYGRDAQQQPSPPPVEEEALDLVHEGDETVRSKPRAGAIPSNTATAGLVAPPPDSGNGVGGGEGEGGEEDQGAAAVDVSVPSESESLSLVSPPPHRADSKDNNSTDEDLSAFMDEFELNTAGEDYRREE